MSAPILSVVGPSHSGAAAPAPAIEIADRPAEALGYATVGERWLALLCDSTVQTLLVGAFLAFFYWKFTIRFDRLKQIALWIIPPAYIIICEVLFHRTLGKWLLRIQVRRDSDEPLYPSPLKILLRESIGKFFSGVVMGIGFFSAVRSPKKKTWHDHMADTVVVRTGVAKRGVKAVLVPILLVVTGWVSVTVEELHTKLEKEIADEMVATDTRIDDLQLRIFQAFSTPEPRSASEYRQSMMALMPTMDEYDRLLDHVSELFDRQYKLNGFLYFEEMTKNTDAFHLRREIAALVREHIQDVLNFDPQKEDWNDLLGDRRELLDQIKVRNNQINRTNHKTGNRQ